MPSFSTSSAQRLLTCDHRLQRLFTEIVKHVDCAIICGHRDQYLQDDAYARGVSQLKWPESKHNSLPSRAVDVVTYPVDWEDVPRFEAFAVIVKEVAARLGIQVRWGGDFPTFKDYPHWELVGP